MTTSFSSLYFHPTLCGKMSNFLLLGINKVNSTEMAISLVWTFAVKDSDGHCVDIVAIQFFSLLIPPGEMHKFYILRDMKVWNLIFFKFWQKTSSNISRQRFLLIDSQLLDGNIRKNKQQVINDSIIGHNIKSCLFLNTFHYRKSLQEINLHQFFMSNLLCI